MPANERARQSLEALALGDAFGERFMRRRHREGIGERRLPEGLWRYTDDTVMAISLVENLRQRGAIEPTALAESFARRYLDEPDRGYGGGARRLLEELAMGGDWRVLAPALFGGGSYGNGAAMRVAPLGAYFAEAELAVVAEQARLSAIPTHAHAEGIAGAIAVAVATAVLWRTRAQPAAEAVRALWAAVLASTPAGLCQDGIVRAAQLPATSSVAEAAEVLGSGRDVTAQDTVPFVLWCVAAWPDDFVELMWRIVSVWGDIDTNCAIAGGIVAGRCALPPTWLEQREALPMER